MCRPLRVGVECESPTRPESKILGRTEFVACEAAFPPTLNPPILGDLNEFLFSYESNFYQSDLVLVIKNILNTFDGTFDNILSFINGIFGSSGIFVRFLLDSI